MFDAASAAPGIHSPHHQVRHPRARITVPRIPSGSAAAAVVAVVAATGAAADVLY
jgi:hypothetical protein